MGCNRHGKCRKNQRSKLGGIRAQGDISPASAATGSRAYRRHQTDRQYPHPVSHFQHHRPDPQSRKTRAYVAPLPPRLPHPPLCRAAGTPPPSSAHGVHLLPAPLRSQQQPWPWPCWGHQKMTLGRTMTATSSSLESPLPRVPPACPVARDHPAAIEVEGAAAVTLSLVPALRATLATRFNSRYHLHRATTFRKARQGPCRTDRIALACARVKVLA